MKSTNVSRCRCHVVCVSLWQTRGEGGMSPFGTTGAQRVESADVKEKTDFHFNYTFQLIDKIDLSPSPSLRQFTECLINLRNMHCV